MATMLFFFKEKNIIQGSFQSNQDIHVKISRVPKLPLHIHFIRNSNDIIFAISGKFFLH